MHSYTEENYLKAIYNLSLKETDGVYTTSIAEKLSTKASSVTDMLKKLAVKKLINYKKYSGVTLTKAGNECAVEIIRKHRLWEVFLVEKLKFKWDEVHEIAEQLEHIQSGELTSRLDKFLQYPEFDPHGDPIPDKNGTIKHHQELLLSDLNTNENAVIIGVKDSSAEFLQYLESMKLFLGTKIQVLKKVDYDNSLYLKINGKKEFSVSHLVGGNLYVKKV